MNEDFPDYRNYLREEFLKRLAKNSSYSLRAFAQNVGLAPSRVSLIFNQRQGLSKAKALAIGKKLGFESRFLNYFVLLVEARHARSKVQRQLALKKLRQNVKSLKRYQSVTEDIFRSISDWWHLAILEMGNLQDFDGDMIKIAELLNIDLKLVTDAVDRLERLSFVERIGGKIKICKSKITTTENVPSAAIRSFHQQILTKAQSAIEGQNVAERNITTMVLPMDIGRIDSLVSLITEFKDKIYDEVQTHEHKSDVYALGVQLFRLTNKEIR